MTVKDNMNDAERILQRKINAKKGCISFPITFVDTKYGQVNEEKSEGLMTVLPLSIEDMLIKINTNSIFDTLAVIILRPNLTAEEWKQMDDDTILAISEELKYYMEYRY